MRVKDATPAPPARRRILIVDDHALVRRGLSALIDNEPDLSVCAAAATQREGLEAIALSRPDLVIADLSLVDADGLALVEEIRAAYPDLPVLVLSMHDAPVWARRAFQAGAKGYVSKQEMTETLLVAIRCVLGGERYVSPKMGTGLDTA
ncbi:MAG: response regulator transcription factor [Burkholderiales bacterium]|nr:response regulator transcription factor [Burkholderiales bacterium]